MQIGAAKNYVVKVFSEKRPIEMSPWVKIGEFSELSEAIGACENVVDDYLNHSENLAKNSEILVSDYLNYGDVPAIYGIDNLDAFNVYEYIIQRCRGIFNPTGSSLQKVSPC
jgi:hypothetical protein